MSNDSGNRLAPMAKVIPLNDRDDLTRLASMNEELTELGNARRLVELSGDDFRYCPERKAWFIWDGISWVQEWDGAMRPMAEKVIKLMHQQAANATDSNTRKSIGAWAVKCETKHQIDAMIDLASAEPGIAVKAAQFDADPLMLGVRNGVIDLKEVCFRQAERDLYITKKCGVAFDPSAQCPRWGGFIDRITGGDADLAVYLQRVAGLCLTGLTREQCFFIFHGTGANGKTVFVTTLQELLGNYACTTSTATLVGQQRPDGASPDLVRLQGTRFVAAAEPEEGCRFSAERVKQLTGQDRIVCRPLYGNFFEFEPQFKVFLLTNFQPQVAAEDEAMWRRIHLVPFCVTIPMGERNPNLIEELRAELPGILNWALDGLRAYWELDGLAPPAAVTNAIDRYRSSMDVLGDWIADCCEVKPGLRTLVAQLRESASSYLSRHGHPAMSQKAFSQSLKRRGFRLAPGKQRMVEGIGLPTPRINDQTQEPTPVNPPTDDTCDGLEAPIEPFPITPTQEDF